MQMLGPMMLGMTAGSLVGHLATRSLGTYDLPVPRPAGNELLIVVPERRPRSATSGACQRDELRLWICLHELAHHTVLEHPARRPARSPSCSSSTCPASGPIPTRSSERLGTLDLGAGPQAFEQMQEILGDPEVVLGAVQSPEQRAMLPRLEAVIAAVIGYVDHVMDSVGTTLMPSYGMLTEALRRRRVESRSIRPLRRTHPRARPLAGGSTTVPTRSSRASSNEKATTALDRLWESAHTLPTPAEIDAPGLWLARIELPRVLAVTTSRRSGLAGLPGGRRPRRRRATHRRDASPCDRSP